MTTHYRLACPVCGRIYEDDHYLLSCPSGCNGLLRSVYDAVRLQVRDAPGLFRYKDWLPAGGTLPTDAAPVCYRSVGLAEAIGLTNLWIVFSGYWPARGAYVTSGSFKEFEAYPTVVRLREHGGGIIVVASAGNTARAFAQVSSETGQPVIIVVPAGAQSRISTTRPAEQLLLVTVDGDYTDAIHLGSLLSTIPGVVSEGGAKNIARRDGMGVVVLEGTRTIGRIPDWYVQGVGSGTGGIAAWEAGIRLCADGRWGNTLPRLYLVQNQPFIPMVNAWQQGRHTLIPDEDMPDPERSITAVFADVLTNRSPPYAVAGGVADALEATHGRMGSATTTDAIRASALIEETEGIDPDPAAAVAVAGLINAVHEGTIMRDDCVLLSITGGGYRLVRDRIVKKPDIVLEKDYSESEVIVLVTGWVSRYA